MDIYEQAKTMNADYYDMATGYIYRIQEYNNELKSNPGARIKVVDLDGNLIGYARRIKED